MTAYGRPALEELRRVVREVKDGDPMRSVTVLMPNNLAGIVARRFLAHGLGDGHHGIAALFPTTARRLAEQLAAPALHPRRPATGPVVAAAWRGALHAEPGVFGKVADHPATVQALIRAGRELRDLDDTALDALAGVQPLGPDLVRLYREVQDSLAPAWYDEHDLLRAAADICRAQPKKAAEVGAVVLYLPQALDQAEAAFMLALSGARPIHTVVGLTSNTKADASVLRSLNRVGVTSDATAELPLATSVLTASDADDEVRCVVRQVVKALTTTKAHRVAVLYTAQNPYARLLHKHLDAAGITINGPGTRPVHERAIARAVLELLDLAGSGPDRDVPRGDLFRVLATAPMRTAHGDRIPVSRWNGCPGPPASCAARTGRPGCPGTQLTNERASLPSWPRTTSARACSPGSPPALRAPRPCGTRRRPSGSIGERKGPAVLDDAERLGLRAGARPHRPQQDPDPTPGRAILVPARTSLPFLETALDRAGVLYRAESSSLGHEAQEVRDLLAATRAIADPSDALSLVTALRSPLSDEAASEHPVGQALSYSQRLDYASRWMTPSEVMTCLTTDRRMREVAAHGPRARHQWRRLRFVVDQARAWSESEHGGLRAYLAWAQQQGEETSRVVEAALPETDAEAVRIMTVHGAKGLEFPIVVMNGMTAGVRHPSGVRVPLTADGYEVSLRKGVTTGDFDVAAPIDEQMDDRERRRLLYVAATRAKDHLVVSLHRAAGSGAKTSAKLLADDGGAAAGAEVWSVDQLAPTIELAARPAGAATHPDRTPGWALTSVRKASRLTSAVSASGLGRVFRILVGVSARIAG